MSVYGVVWYVWYGTIACSAKVVSKADYEEVVWCGSFSWDVVLGLNTNNFQNKFATTL